MTRELRAIVFDFDGVILESVGIKTNAFRDLLPGDRTLQDRMEQYHLQHLGMSRYEKFSWMYRELLCRPLPPQEMAALDARFSTAIAAQMRSCPFVTGAAEFLRAHAESEPLYVASGTPEQELRSIVADRGLAPLFKGVYGSPTTKAQVLAQVWHDVGGPPEGVWFIGDSRQDADAARAVGVTFVARVTPNGDSFGDVPAFRVAELEELERRLPEIARRRSTPSDVHPR